MGFLAPTEGNVFHNPRLGDHGRRRYDHSDDPSGNTVTVVQAAGAFAGKPIAVEERQLRWGTIHLRNAGEVRGTIPSRSIATICSNVRHPSVDDIELGPCQNPQRPRPGWTSPCKPSRIFDARAIAHP